MNKFKGKFQEACQVNWNRPRWSYMWHEMFGWNACQHCHCRVCEERREELKLERCLKGKRCTACVKKTIYRVREILKGE